MNKIIMLGDSLIDWNYNSHMKIMEKMGIGAEMFFGY